jgi:hypothetical protein
MKIIVGLISLLIVVFGFSTPGFSQDTHSGRAVTHGSEASGNASGSAAHAIAGSGQAVSGAASVPFMASGAAGAASAQVGDDLHDAASAPIGEPLKITDETITIGLPPDQALKTNTTE